MLVLKRSAQCSAELGAAGSFYHPDKAVHSDPKVMPILERWGCGVRLHSLTPPADGAGVARSLWLLSTNKWEPES